MSRISGSAHIASRSRSTGDAPQFWELEKLIQAGLARELALDVLAARRFCREYGLTGRIAGRVPDATARPSTVEIH